MSRAVREVAICVVLWAALVACAAALWREPGWLTLIYAVASVVLLAIWRSRQQWAMYALGFILGPGGEIIAIRFGAWEYAEASWLIPLWLLPAWGLAALILFQIASAIGSGSRRT